MSRPGDHDDEVPFDPFDEEEDPFRPQRPLRDPLRPDLDPFRIPDDPFQLDDPFQAPGDSYAAPDDPYGKPGERTDAFDPDQAQPAPPPQDPPWGSPPPQRRWPAEDRPEPPPVPRPERPEGGQPPSDQQRQAPIPNRAARHQQKRRIPWRSSKGSGAPDKAPPGPAARRPADPSTTGPFPRVPGPREGGSTGPFPPVPGPREPGAREGGDDPGRVVPGPSGLGGLAGRPPSPPSPPRPDPRSGDPRPGGSAPTARGGPGLGARGGPGGSTGPFGPIPGSGAPPRPGGPRPGGTTGPFERIPDVGSTRPGGTTGPFDAVAGGRSTGSTGPFEAIRPDRPGSTGEFPLPSSNGRNAEPAAAAGRGAPSRADRGGRRSPHQARQLPSLPRFEVPTGLARTTVGLVAVLVLATAGLGVVTNVLPRAKPPATPATAAPYSARWICPLLPNQSASIGVANVGGNPASLRTTVVTGAGNAQPSQKPLASGGLRTIKAPAAKQPGYVQVEAFSSPVAVGSGGQASCASGPTDRWWIPAADTSLGASTAVVVANPDNDPAVVDLVPHVNQGALAAAAELFIPPRSAKVQTLSNGELIALKPAIEVIAKSGRVVAGAVIAQKDRQKIFVPGQPTTRSEWSFAGGLAGPDRSTSVLITNPSASPLSVSVQVSTDQGTFRPGNDFDNPIPGGSSAAIQVPPLRIRGSGAFALRISSRDGANFVAALRVATPTDAGDVTYLDLGTGGSDRSWFVPTVPASKQVVLANLGSGPVSARLGGPGKDGPNVKVDPGKVVVRQVPSGAKSLEVATDQPGLVVAPLGGGLAVAGAEIGGLPAGGPVVAGPAAD